MEAEKSFNLKPFMTFISYGQKFSLLTLSFIGECFSKKSSKARLIDAKQFSLDSSRHIIYKLTKICNISNEIKTKYPKVDGFVFNFKGRRERSVES